MTKKYKIFEHDETMIHDVETHAQFDPNNTKYNEDAVAYQAWLAEGNTPDPQFSEERLIELEKEKKEKDTRELYAIDSVAPCTIKDIGTFNGGFESAMLIQGAIQLSENLERDYVVITDSDNIAHYLSHTEAKEVVTAIALQAETAFLKKQTSLVDLKKEK